MKRKRRQRIISTRLSDEDQVRFEFLCMFRGRSRSEVAREALIEFLDKSVEANNVKQQNELSQQLKKQGERLAKMLARTMIEVAILNKVIYKRADTSTRDALWSEAREAALRHLNKNKKDGDKDASEVADNAFGGEA